MTNLPAPPIPTDIDFTKVDGFFLDTTRLLGSELVIVSTGDEFKAAVLLWCHAWKQRPACSLPDEDRILAGYARVAPQRWKKLREVALRGFVKCSDGRLYHLVLAADAIRAWDAVQRQRARTQAATEARRRSVQLTADREPYRKAAQDRNDNRDGQRNDNRDDDRYGGHAAHRDGDRDDHRNGHHGTGRDVTSKKERSISSSSSTAAEPPPARRVAEDFAVKHAEVWPDYSEFRLLRRFPDSLVAEAQAWIDRGLSPDLLSATLADGMDRWMRDAEPPRGLKPFVRDLERAAALAKGQAANATGRLTKPEDDRLAYLTAHLRPDLDGMWLPEWGTRPASAEDAELELHRLEAKRDGRAAA